MVSQERRHHRRSAQEYYRSQRSYYKDGGTLERPRTHENTPKSLADDTGACRVKQEDSRADTYACSANPATKLIHSKSGKYCWYIVLFFSY